MDNGIRSRRLDRGGLEGSSIPRGDDSGSGRDSEEGSGGLRTSSSVVLDDTSIKELLRRFSIANEV